MTGLAGALALERDPVLAQALAQAEVLLAGIQHADGSYPYHPLEWGAEHAGAADVSAFYQSRVTGFLAYAWERAGLDLGEPARRAVLERGLDFLAGLSGPDGIKAGLVEAKPWYWGAEYEVASHPFDVYALARGYALLGKASLGRAAAAAFRAWAAHLDASGRPESHRPGPGRGRSYQCALFWAGHACWIARALPELARALALPEAELGTCVPSMRWFAGAELARLEDRAVVAWVRGARPASNVHHGSPHGAGLLRVFGKAEGAELLARQRLSGVDEGEWSARAGLPAPLRGLRSGAREVRFSGWLARVHWRAGRRREALGAPLDALCRGVLAFSSTRASSAFELAPATRLLPLGIEVRGRLCHRGGAAVRGSAFERAFEVDGSGLCVRERLLEPGSARGAAYRVPAAARDVQEGPGECSYRLS
jgi:hypothetical protein